MTSLSNRLRKLEDKLWPYPVPPETAFRELALQLYGREDSIAWSARDELREICVSPYEGAYGHAGYVIAINGSPPRGTFVTAPYGHIVYITSDGHARRLGEAQRAVVHAYLKSLEIDLPSSV